MQGLAEHKDELGAPLCPCRHYDDKKLEAEQGFWNCPCVPMRERKVRYALAVLCRGVCLCWPATTGVVSHSCPAPAGTSFFAG